MIVAANRATTDISRVGLRYRRQNVNNNLEWLLIWSVWQKAIPIPGFSPDEWRRDYTGHIIHFSEYGKTSKYGWEIDHEIPKKRGGLDSISNLSPLQWHENRKKSDKTPAEYAMSEFIKNLRAAQGVA